MVYILDTYSRRIVGWSMDSHMRTELVVDALEMAVQRGLERLPLVLWRKDRGA